jgi:predicted  nucleic acid-binding Zn-ribbon protein
MAEAPDNIVLEYLRRFDRKLDTMADDLRDLKVRMTSVETGLAGVQRRIDRVEERLERIERRLDLADA